jgi:hypothetical protein
MPIAKRPLLTLLLGVMSLLIACDGGVYLKGVVYRWVDPPPGASSKVFVDQAWALPVRLSPLADAEVTIYDSLEDARRGHPEVGNWQKKSAADGSFDVGGTTAPGNHTMAVAVTRAGCSTVYGTYLNHGSGEPHTVAVVLVCHDYH